MPQRRGLLGQNEPSRPITEPPLACQLPSLGCSPSTKHFLYLTGAVRFGLGETMYTNRRLRDCRVPSSVNGAISSDSHTLLGELTGGLLKERCSAANAIPPKTWNVPEGCRFPLVPTCPVLPTYKATFMLKQLFVIGPRCIKPRKSDPSGCKEGLDRPR